MSNKQHRIARRSFRKQKRNERPFTLQDAQHFMQGQTFEPKADIIRIGKEDHIIRVEGNANRFGLGKIVSNGVVFFARGDYNMTREQLNRRLGIKK